MPKKQYLDSDLTPVQNLNPEDPKKKLLTTLFWGDEVEITGEVDGKPTMTLVRDEWNEETRNYDAVSYDAVLPKNTRFRKEPLLKARFVDVGQGDGAMLESPKGRRVLIDGGEGPHLRRYMQRAFSHVVRKKPLHLDAIVVTHGDADHFAGLTQLATATGSAGGPLIEVDAVFHNGLVKGPSALGDVKILGKTKQVDGRPHIVELHDEIFDLPATRLNVPFKAWVAALGQLRDRNPSLKMKRLEYGNSDDFGFLAEEGVGVEVLGPIVKDGGLPFLRTPGGSSPSASHTINGHSVVLRVTYGNVRFLFGADLNEESEESLLARCRADGQSLASEILKVPHHGSADFSTALLEAIRPVVSVVSSGDENAAKDYIHPRAGLVGALGKYSRASVPRPLVYVTEMVAFFQKLGSVRAYARNDDGSDGKEIGTFANAYNKASFGIVHVRTDGQRVLVVTHSGSSRKEAYVFHVDERGNITFD